MRGFEIGAKASAAGVVEAVLSQETRRLDAGRAQELIDEMRAAGLPI